MPHPMGGTLWASLNGWACRADAPCPAALAAGEAGLTPPLTSGLRAAQRGKWCRPAVDPPASRHRLPRHRAGPLGLDRGPRWPPSERRRPTVRTFGEPVATNAGNRDAMRSGDKGGNDTGIGRQFESPHVRRTIARDRTGADFQAWGPTNTDRHLKEPLLYVIKVCQNSTFVHT